MWHFIRNGRSPLLPLPPILHSLELYVRGFGCSFPLVDIQVFVYGLDPVEVFEVCTIYDTIAQRCRKECNSRLFLKEPSRCRGLYGMLSLFKDWLALNNFNQLKNFGAICSKIKQVAFSSFDTYFHCFAPALLCSSLAVLYPFYLPVVFSTTLLRDVPI